MSTPSASSRSAEPHLLVLERLPCLATAQPAPAATSAAVVETLKVEGPPPVPAVSTRSRRAGPTGAASDAHRPRQPDQLGDRLPLRPQGDQEGAGLDRVGAPLHDLGQHRRGVVGGEVVAGADRVDRAADDVVRHRPSIPPRGSWRAGACPAGSAPTRGGTGRPRPAARGGGRPSRSRRGWRSARARRAGRGRRPASGSGRRPAGSAGRRRSRLPSCSTSASLPWIGSPLDDPAAERLDHRLVAEADAEHRRPGLGEGADRRAGDPRLGRRAGAGRDDQPVGAARRAARRPSAWSLRTTSISAPSSPRYWTRL